MNVIKVTLGFLELAFALKFLSVADLAYGWRILDRETFLALWIVIFGLLGFYLLGKIKFPHDDVTIHKCTPLLYGIDFFGIRRIYGSRIVGSTVKGCQRVRSSYDNSGFQFV